MNQNPRRKFAFRYNFEGVLCGRWSCAKISINKLVESAKTETQGSEAKAWKGSNVDLKMLNRFKIEILFESV